MPLEVSTGRVRVRSAVAGVAAFAVAVAALWGLRVAFGYVLFHSVVEIFAIAVALALFLTVWGVRRNIENGYLLWLAIGYACAATVDLAHTLLYKGVGILPGIGSNPATQMWLVARYIQAGTLLTAPLWIRRRVPIPAALTGFLLVTAAGMAAVASGRFPSAYAEGTGLTEFKVLSEWAIVGMMSFALVWLVRREDAFAPGTLRMVAWSIALTIGSEMAFTLYGDPYGAANFVGHVLRMAAVFFVYRALVLAAVSEPLRVLFRETEEAHRQLATSKEAAETLNRIDLAITSSLDADEIMRRVVEDATQEIGADAAVVMMREGEAWVVRHAYRFPGEIIGQQYDDAHAQVTVLTAVRREVLTLDETDDEPWGDAEFRARYGVRSVLAVPLVSRDEVMGVLYFMCLGEPRRFTEAHLEFANGLASAVALALDNSRLYAEQREIADTLQSALLHMPESLPGVEIAHDYRAASDLARIGGDFYDAFTLDGGLVGFVLGDVTGKGLPAAKSTYVARSTFRAYADMDPTPTEVLSRTNLALSHQLDDGQFITAVYGVIDTSNGALRYGRAGHPEPVVCGPDGCQPGSTAGNPPLGPFPDTVFEESELRLRPGDVALVFSDGLVDTRSAGREMFGEPRVREILERLAEAGPEAVVSGIMAAVAEFGGGRVTDDVTLIALRWPGPSDG